MTQSRVLSTRDHSRDSAGLTYVYPVISRRAGGLSIGINLNPNNACNWRCIYCQVPGLQRGSAPAIDLNQLRTELNDFLVDVAHADFFDRFEVEAQYRTIRDIAISGNGEPTSATNFNVIVDLVGALMEKFELRGDISLVLITNGSLVHRPMIQNGLTKLNRYGGVVWFKLDRATDKGLAQINNAGLSVKRVRENLIKSAELCETWVQTSIFSLDGKTMSIDEQDAYLSLLESVFNQTTAFKGVLLYGLARTSLQPEASRLSNAHESWIKQFVHQIEDLGLTVKIKA